MPPFDESKYVEVKKKQFPRSWKAGSGIEIVIYHYNDPKKEIPRISIREYYTDNNGETKRAKGTKLDWEMIPEIIESLKRAHDIHEQKNKN